MRNWMSYGIALVIIVVIGIWMATGTLVIGGKGPGNGETQIVSLVEGNDGPMEKTIDELGLRTEDQQGTQEIDPAKSIAERNAENAGGENGTVRSVRIQTFAAQPFAMEVTVRGRTEARDIVAASSETSGVVDSVDVAKGDRVEKGDLLCTLDKGTRQASVAQAEAGLAQAQASLDRAQADFDTNKDLRDRGLAAENTGRPLEVALSSAKAGLKQAQAGLDQANAELERTEIHARVGGVVSDPMTSEGALLNPGGVCATIIQLDPIVFAGSVPEARIGLARTGLPVHVTTVAGDELDGKVSYIASKADDATRSFAVEAEMDNPNGKVRDGLTATATVKAGTIPAQLLPQSVLTLGEQGELGVRAVDKDSKVVFYPVSIVSDQTDGVWVTGLPASVDIITLGQENVQAGQTVKAGRYDDKEGDA